MYCLEIWRHTYKSNIDCIHVIQKNVLELGFTNPIDFSLKNYLKIIVKVVKYL